MYTYNFIHELLLNNIIFVYYLIHKLYKYTCINLFFVDRL